MISNYFHNPVRNFEYVGDDMLWNKIFKNPVPIDPKRVGIGAVNLSKYFTVEGITLSTKRGPKARKLILANETFYEVEDDERVPAFVAFKNFLVRFNRPFRDCYLSVPNHPSINQDDEFSPAHFYFRDPQFPRLNDDFTKIRLNFDLDYFKKIHEYSFGYKLDEDLSPEDCDLDFSYPCFRGYLLQY